MEKNLLLSISIGLIILFIAISVIVQSNFNLFKSACDSDVEGFLNNCDDGQIKCSIGETRRIEGKTSICDGTRTWIECNRDLVDFEIEVLGTKRVCTSGDYYWNAA